MDVKSIIKRASAYGVGLDDPTPDVLEIYVQHLNMAHYELWETISRIDYSGFGITSPLTLGSNTVKGVSDVIDFFVLDPITRNPFNLKKTFYIDVLRDDPSESKYGQPNKWYWKNHGSAYSFFTYPKISRDPGDLEMYICRLFYIPTPVDLKYTDQESDIPYPIDIHNLLVYGTIYFALQDEQGFTSSSDMNIHISRWENKKNILLARYQNQKLSPINVTTYV